MGIFFEVKCLLPSGRKTLLAEIRGLAQEQCLTRLGGIFHDACFERAARFVRDHAARKDSPFLGISGDRLFHEMMGVNFWVVERLLAGKRPLLMERIYGIYEASCSMPGSCSHDVSGGFSQGHVAYSASWNDVTGHQDVFAQRVAERIIGPGRTFSVPETSFWIISYTYEAMDDLNELVTLCRRMKIPMA